MAEVKGGSASGAVKLPAGVSEEDIAKGLKLLEQQKTQRAKYAQKIKEKTPEQKASEKEKYAKYGAKQRLVLQKAVAAGITVTDKEVDEYLAKQAAEAGKK